MESLTYDWIWNQLSESIDEISEKYFSYTEFEFHLAYSKESAKKKILREYNKIRKELKGELYGANADNKRMDRHKIAACFCEAFIECKQFAFIVSDNTPTDVLLSNYELAYVSSLRVLYLFMLYEYLKDGRQQYFHKLLNASKLLVPETSSTHDTYNKGRIKTLASNDYYGKEFDLLTYADMMFWIEQYNKWLIEGKLMIE